MRLPGLDLDERVHHALQRELVRTRWSREQEGAAQRDERDEGSTAAVGHGLESPRINGREVEVRPPGRRAGARSQSSSSSSWRTNFWMRRPLMVSPVNRLPLESSASVCRNVNSPDWCPGLPKPLRIDPDRRFKVQRISFPPSVSKRKVWAPSTEKSTSHADPAVPRAGTPNGLGKFPVPGLMGMICTGWQPRLVAYTSPSLLMAIACGWPPSAGWNCPGPRPELPHWRR